MTDMMQKCKRPTVFRPTAPDKCLCRTCRLIRRIEELEVLVKDNAMMRDDIIRKLQSRIEAALKLADDADAFGGDGLVVTKELREALGGSDAD